MADVALIKVPGSGGRVEAIVAPGPKPYLLSLVLVVLGLWGVVAMLAPGPHVDGKRRSATVHRGAHPLSAIPFALFGAAGAAFGYALLRHQRQPPRLALDPTRQQLIFEPHWLHGPLVIPFAGLQGLVLTRVVGASHAFTLHVRRDGGEQLIWGGLPGTGDADPLAVAAFVQGYLPPGLPFEERTPDGAPMRKA